jgi:hypothetical protein
MITQKRFLVAGVVRNCARSVKDEVLRIKDALSAAKNTSWLLIESDSTDSTLSALAELKSGISDFDYISLGTLRDKMRLRTERIAYCRNAYINEMRSNNKYQDVDYVVVADFDGMNSDLTAASIASCWERGDWDVCAANQKGPYYDLWALRHNEWSPNDCFEQYRFYLNMKQAAFKAYYASVYARMISVPLDADWIEVDSAFGGLAIYKKAAMDPAEYTGLTVDGKEVCEHVSFHGKLRQQGYRIFINPRLINKRGSQHAHKTLGKMVALLFLGRSGFDRLKQIFGARRSEI